MRQKDSKTLHSWLKAGSSPIGCISAHLTKGLAPARSHFKAYMHFDRRESRVLSAIQADSQLCNTFGQAATRMAWRRNHEVAVEYLNRDQKCLMLASLCFNTSREGFWE